MKITIHNRFAGTLNMEGRRGEKLAFGKYKVCTTIIGNLNIFSIYIQWCIAKNIRGYTFGYMRPSRILDLWCQ